MDPSCLPQGNGQVEYFLLCMNFSEAGKSINQVLTFSVAYAYVHAMKMFLIITKAYSDIFLKKFSIPFKKYFKKHMKMSSLYLFVFHDSTKTDDNFLFVLCKGHHYHVRRLIWWTCWRSRTLTEARHLPSATTNRDRKCIECNLSCLKNRIFSSCISVSIRIGYKTTKLSTLNNGCYKLDWTIVSWRGPPCECHVTKFHWTTLICHTRFPLSKAVQICCDRWNANKPSN